MKKPLRNIPDSMDAAVVGEIDNRLASICADENVKIPWAIESGSRAWGFPSPDSDYDCRFVYIRPLADSLRLFPKRDVIEMPITPVFDVSGWELSKALKLLLKGNAVIIEWLMSPIVYDGNPVFREEFLSLADAIANRGLIANHYLRLATSMRDTTLKNSKEVPLKKLFYILRPLMALDWLYANPGKTVVPMHFPTLVEQVNLPKSLDDTIKELIEAKGRTRELGTGVMPLAIQEYLTQAFDRWEQKKFSAEKATADQFNLADEFHVRWIGCSSR